MFIARAKDSSSISQTQEKPFSNGCKLLSLFPTPIKKRVWQMAGILN